MEGEQVSEDPGQVFANFGGAKRLMVGSDPPGLLSSSETFPETNSSYTRSNKNGLEVLGTISPPLKLMEYVEQIIKGLVLPDFIGYE